MATRVKQTTYGPIWATMNSEGTLLFGDNEAMLSATPPLVRPGVTLLYSIASCMILSLQAVAKRKRLTIHPFSIEVTSHKGEELPVHFARYDIALSHGCHSDPDIAMQLLNSAKSICTVSNSLSGTFTLRIRDE